MKTKQFRFCAGPGALAGLSLCLIALCFQLSAMAQGTAFTYQGRLIDNGSVSNNIYDLRVLLFNALAGGSQVGSTVLLDNVPVTNGLFTVSLNFGAGSFDGTARWLEIGVRPGLSTGAYSTLAPRQAITPSPYAVYAGTAASAATSSGLTLPYTGSAASSGSIFTLNNSGTGPAEVLYGKVGIGTATPGYQLTVQAPGSGLDVISWGNPNAELGRLGTIGGGQDAGFLGLFYSGALGVDIRASGNSYFNGGNVGIGTATPQALLDIQGSMNVGGTILWPYNQFGNPQLAISGYLRTNLISTSWTAATGDYMDLETPGNQGPGNRLRMTSLGNAGFGTTLPQEPLHIYSPNNPTTLRLQSSAGFGSARMEFWSDLQGGPNEWRPGFIQSEDAGGFTGQLVFYVNGSGYANRTASVEALRLNGGNASVCTLTIRGGCDLAEPFQMSEKEIPKGSLVIIDETSPGKLKLSDHAYDTRVAGIISGANGINPGISLHQEGAFEGGENVALSGRVYALADASMGPIKPGDLLTTSALPGHCMKATDHAQAQGAVIGKAMSSLAGGQGMVLVLVSLQ